MSERDDFVKTLCVIPARFASTRLPGKPLADIAGKPMISRVYARAAKAKLVSDVIAAVDDQRVFDAVVENGGKAMMTRKDHATGTDRLAEVAHEDFHQYSITWGAQKWQKLIRKQN